MACMVLGLYTSTVFCEQIICSMPNQSAKRIIVPRFPGSCTSSNARQSDWRTTSDSMYRMVVRKWQVPVGEFSINWPVKDLPVKLLPVHLHLYRDVFGSHEEVAAKKRQGKCPSKSPTNLGPSARNTPSSLRIFFSSSEWIYFILFLLSDAINLIFFCKAIKIFPIYPYFPLFFLIYFSRQKI